MTGTSDSRPDLRYGGFEHALGLRRYRFDAVARGEATRHFIVTVDLRLLLEHHVSIQDLPALCMHKLETALELSSDPLRCELAVEDLRAFASSRAAAAERKKRKPGFQPQRHGVTASPWRRPPGAL